MKKKSNNGFAQKHLIIDWDFWTLYISNYYKTSFTFILILNSLIVGNLEKLSKLKTFMYW